MQFLLRTISASTGEFHMRVLMRCVAIGVVVGSAVVFTAGANAAPPETAPPGTAQVLSHVPMWTRGHNPQGVPGPARTAASKLTSNGINYHGGPVFTTAVNVYLIWYGNWSGNTATAILPTLVTGLSGSPYYQINTTYYDGANRTVPNAVTLAGQTADAYSQGATNLSDSNINAIVASAIEQPAAVGLPTALYFVLTSADVTKSGFRTSYCGWHANGRIGGADIKYAFVGNPGPTACEAQTTSSRTATWVRTRWRV